MADNSLDELKKLSPKERLAKLKEIEKKNKDEIELARKLISESEREAEIEDELSSIPMPEAKAIDIDGLFSPEAKEIWKIQRFEEGREKKKADLEEESAKAKPSQGGLEDAVAFEAEKHREEMRQVQYGLAIEEAKSMAEKLANAYDTIRDLTSKEYLSDSEQQRLESYGEMAKTLYEEKFTPSQKPDREKMLAVEKMLYDSGHY